MRARVGVTESHRARERQGEIQYAPERASESLREQVRARGSQSGSHIEPFGRLVTKKRLASHFSIPKHCFVAKQINKTLFCRDTSKYGILCRKLLKHAL